LGVLAILGDWLGDWGVGKSHCTGWTVL